MNRKSGLDSKRMPMTPLMIACMEGHSEMIEYLLNQAADVSITAENGANALYFASNRRSTSTDEML